MNGKSNQSDCDHFELLISCSLDGELTCQEQLELSRHMDLCASCRGRNVSFQTVNELAGRLGVIVEIPAMKVVDSSTMDQPVDRKKEEIRWHRFLPYAALVGLAAALVVALGVFMPDSKRAVASEIVVPLVSLVQINSTRQDDHVFMKESLELDMRTLRLQIDSIDNQDHRHELKERYEQLLKRIKEI